MLNIRKQILTNKTEQPTQKQHKQVPNKHDTANSHTTQTNNTNQY